MLNREEVAHQILGKISELLSVEPNELERSVTLDEVGLDSLSLARLFMELEQHFGFDILADGQNTVSDLRTIDNLIDAYTSSTAKAAVSHEATV